MAFNEAEWMARVERMETVGDGIIALCNSLAQQIRDAGTNAAALAAIATRLDNQATEISDAIVANTPAEEPPPPPV